MEVGGASTFTENCDEGAGKDFAEKNLNTVFEVWL